MLYEFVMLRVIFSSEIFQCFKTKDFNHCLLPVMTSGSETWLRTHNHPSALVPNYLVLAQYATHYFIKLSVTIDSIKCRIFVFQAIERAMFGINVRS